MGKLDVALNYLPITIYHLPIYHLSTNKCTTNHKNNRKRTLTISHRQRNLHSDYFDAVAGEEWAKGVAKQIAQAVQAGERGRQV